jgi:hypothetical protein
MTKLTKTLIAVAAGTLLATGAFAQSASEIRGASPYSTMQFYGGLGWRLDADFASGDDWRAVQFTPLGAEMA